ncbi:hypothetical protein PG997_001814 [Apiospora hydei]|uniref:Uncharacterized protein n=1 Tax=Apiospora hydei TaxID=1337664 RepID=A0ABR1X7N7_9PEZI
MKPAGVLMVGSVPGGSPQEVFTRLATALPGRLSAIPDGETGERWNYIGWQLQRFPTVARRNELGGTPLPESGLGSVLSAFTLDDIKPTAYDEAALSSYAEFKHLRQRGIIPSNVRFQIGLPSPYSVLAGHIKPEVANAIEPLYEQRFAETIDRIFAEIPTEEVVIQWDLCFEMTALEFELGRLPDKRHQSYFSSPGGVQQGLVDRVARLCERIPKDGKLAFHLCYGDLRHKHFVEPQDTSLLVDLANALLERETIGPRTEWVHLPVPKERTDPGYFAPLVRLRLDAPGLKPPRLYLGVVHANDEVGTKKRVETAQAVVPFPFGVATECGLGRTPPGEVDSILRICKEITQDPIRENL